MLDTCEERVAWKIARFKVVGTVFVKIIDENKKTILGRIFDEYGAHEIRFSKKTGKEWRAHQWNYLWLTKQKVIRK